MWHQHQQMDQKFADYSDKHCLQSREGDSGFISSDNLYSSEFSSSSLSYDKEPEPVESPKAMDSGLVDFGFCDSLSQLSLKHVSLDQLVSKKSTTTNDSGKVSTTSSADNVQETCQASWQLYFTQNEDGDTFLHASIIQGFLEATLNLIKIAPHPNLLNILNDDSQTALHLAVMTEQPKIVRRLVLAGADMSIRNHQGNTALHLACIQNNLDCAKALTKPITAYEGSFLSSQRLPIVPLNLEQRNYYGETCLHVAAARNHVDLVRLLVGLNADIDSQESLGGRTALHLALERGCLDVVNYILHECRAHLDATTYSGCTAYQIASCVDEKIARELVRFGATSVPREETAEFKESDFFAAVAAAQV